MTHWKKLLDPGVYLIPADFEVERPITIARVAREKKPAREGEKEESGVMLYIRARDGSEFPRPMVVPKSVLYALGIEFGTPDVEQWAGRQVAFFATRCLSFGEVDECIRPRVSPANDRRVRAWLKKRKASPRMWIDGDTPPPPAPKAPAATTPAPTTQGGTP